MKIQISYGLDIRDWAIIIRRGLKNQTGWGEGGLNKNNAKIGGTQIKITLIIGGTYFSFYAMCLCIKL